MILKKHTYYFKLSIVITCQNLIVRAVGYRQRVGVQSVGVSDVWAQGSKTWLKLMCFTLAAGTGVSLDFVGLELRSRNWSRVGRLIRT